LKKTISANQSHLDFSRERLDSLSDLKNSCEYKKENYYYEADADEKLYWNRTVFEQPE
jgi:hypothetical protein